ncbi:hypothetical protein UlMin_037613 [Ulmus minor]
MAVVEKGDRVCVTGAGGFVASWVINHLLSKDYIIHGTVRDPNDKKNAHLSNLDKACDNLKLFKADLLDYQSILLAIEGCTGVFHVASPVPYTTVPNPEAKLLEPAVKGTLNVLKACLEAKVKRVVFVSSAAAVITNPKWPKGQAMDETCWSDKEFCKTTKSWYSLSKTEAESEAIEFSGRTGLDVVTICPTLVIGPILQSNVNASTSVLLNILKEGSELLEDKYRMIVDVRDVAEAILMAYEKPKAEGRYICSAHNIKVKDLVEKLRSLYPKYNYPHSFTEVLGETILSTEKLQKIGWRCRSLDETLVDSIESYRAAGLLD